MNELQKARADWLDAESRALKLEKENSDLRQQIFELQMNTMALEARVIIAESMSQNLTKVLLTCGSSG